MSETLVMPLLNCGGRHGRKGSLPLKAREADRWGCTCALFLCPDLEYPNKILESSTAVPDSGGSGNRRGICMEMAHFAVIRSNF